MLEKTEVPMKNGLSRDTGNIGHTTQTKAKNHNTICVVYHYAQINTTNVNKTRGKYANGLLCKKKEMYSINFCR